jgi:hypothetical protein
VALIVSGACIGVSILLALVGKLLRHYDILSGAGAPAAFELHVPQHGIALAFLL